MTEITFGVLFDMDGVIVDSNPAHKLTIQQFCEKQGIEVTEEFLREKIYGRTNKEWLPELFGGDITEMQLKEFADEKEQMFREVFKKDLKPVPGLIQFLKDLKLHDVKMVVATSAPGENAEFILNGLEIRDYFDTVIDASHVTKGKPEPDVYLQASSAINMPAYNNVVFEDSLAGVQAAKSAGCKVVGITTTHTAEELAGCDLVIDDFHNLNAKSLSALFQKGEYKLQQK